MKDDDRWKTMQAEHISLKVALLVNTCKRGGYPIVEPTSNEPPPKVVYQPIMAHDANALKMVYKYRLNAIFWLNKFVILMPRFFWNAEKLRNPFYTQIICPSSKMSQNFSINLWLTDSSKMPGSNSRPLAHVLDDFQLLNHARFRGRLRRRKNITLRPCDWVRNDSKLSSTLGFHRTVMMALNSFTANACANVKMTCKYRAPIEVRSDVKLYHLTSRS